MSAYEGCCAVGSMGWVSALVVGVVRGGGGAISAAGEPPSALIRLARQSIVGMLLGVRKNPVERPSSILPDAR